MRRVYLDTHCHQIRVVDAYWVMPWDIVDRPWDDFSPFAVGSVGKAKQEKGTFPYVLAPWFARLLDQRINKLIFHALAVG